MNEKPKEQTVLRRTKGTQRTMTHYAFEIAQVQRTGRTAQANSHYIYVITPHYITSYVLFHLLLQCRTLGNATVGRQITVCTMTHCVMMSLDQRFWSDKHSAM